MDILSKNLSTNQSTKMQLSIDDYPDRIEEIFEGKTILLTGGTGYVGKVLIEKILRCVDGVKKIYVLIRTKKGKDPNFRLKEIFLGPLFDKVKKLKGPKVFNKVVAIAGDVTSPDLALSPEDRQLLIDEVQFIYHCAATIRFDEPLRNAVLLNVRGVKLMLELAKQMKKLEIFNHLSTAYCHLSERVLYEKAYPPPADPHNVIKTAEWLDDETLNLITPKILGDMPNTYCFTKALGEALVVDEMPNLPIIILRPSIVLPIWKEPIPGWTDNINGPTGLLIGAGKGVIRTMYCNGSSYGDFVPVDILVNSMLLSMCDFVIFSGQRIFNITSSAEYKVSWEEIIEIGRNIIETRMPLNGVAWYPGGSMKKSRLIHNICVILFHYLPALFVDSLLFILGYKPILWRIQQRITKGFEVFEYYANNQWDFNNEKSLELRELMNPKEKEKYKVDGSGMNYDEYFFNCIHAARVYILKEPDSTLPSARRHMKVMWVVDKLTKGIMLFLFLYYIVWKRILLPIFGDILQ